MNPDQPTENEVRAVELVEEMHALIKKHMLKKGPECDAAMARVKEITKEVNSFGFWLKWEMKVRIDLNDPEKKDVDVQITVYKPRPDMDPETKKKYDEWFKKVNGIE